MLGKPWVLRLLLSSKKGVGDASARDGESACCACCRCWWWSCGEDKGSEV
jgi:hypothetical protein